MIKIYKNHRAHYLHSTVQEKKKKKKEELNRK